MPFVYLRVRASPSSTSMHRGSDATSYFGGRVPEVHVQEKGMTPMEGIFSLYEMRTTISKAFLGESVPLIVNLMCTVTVGA
jgi:hypothetical protein